MSPSQAGFLTFLRGIVGIPMAALADNAPVIGYAYNVALATVNAQLIVAGALPSASWSLYAIAVYNLGADRVVNFAQDVPPSTYFADLRKALNLTQFVVGTISESHDEATGQGMTVPDFVAGLTIADLQTIRTPWGRQYMGLAQATGTLWGIS